MCLNLRPPGRRRSFLPRTIGAELAYTHTVHPRRRHYFASIYITDNTAVTAAAETGNFSPCVAKMLSALYFRNRARARTLLFASEYFRRLHYACGALLSIKRRLCTTELFNAPALQLISEKYRLHGSGNYLRRLVSPATVSFFAEL